MKKTILFLVLLLTACGPTQFDLQSLVPEVLGSPLPSATAWPTETATLEPSPTVGYQSTAIAAQQTADAAVRQALEFTAEVERRQFEQLSFTSEAEQRDMWIYGQTATAALTSVPATQTQGAFLNGAIGAQLSVMGTSQVMTQQAPTMIVAMANAQTQAQFAQTEAIVRIFLLLALGIFLWGVGLWAGLARPKKIEDAPIQPVTLPRVPEDLPIIHPIDMGTMVAIRKTEGGFSSDAIQKVPCTAEQLTELAEGLISGEKTLSFKYWEGADSKLNRDVYRHVRHFLQVNKYAIGAGKGSGNLVLTDDGEAFFRGWLDRGALPYQYEFMPMTAESTGETAHDHEIHDHEEGVGDPKTPEIKLVPA